MSAGAASEQDCTWCGRPVEPGEGYRLDEEPGERSAVFCRLEHVVPWSIQGPHWNPGTTGAAGGADRPADCAHCGEPLGDVRLTLVRHRGEHRIPDAFCSVDHLAAFAKAGGRYGRKP